MLLAARGDDDLPLRAVRAGAAGYLTKDVDPELLPRVVRKVADGEAAIPRATVMRLLEWMREVPDSGWRPLRSRLTSREWEMVDLLAGGATTEAIAEGLVLSPATVYSHVKSLLRKLGSIRGATQWRLPTGCDERRPRSRHDDAVTRRRGSGGSR